MKTQTSNVGSTNKIHEIYVTKKQLAARGWTDGMIKKTGLPVVQGKEYKHGMMVKINYYPFSKVKEAEQAEDFAEMKAKAEKARMARVRKEEMKIIEQVCPELVSN